MLPEPYRAPSKVAGVVYLLFAVFALFIAAFVIVFPSGLSPNMRYMFGALLAFYGLFRLFTGIRTIKKAAEYENEMKARGSNTTARP